MLTTKANGKTDNPMGEEQSISNQEAIFKENLTKEMCSVKTASSFSQMDPAIVDLSLTLYFQDRAPSPPLLMLYTQANGKMECLTVREKKLFQMATAIKENL